MSAAAAVVQVQQRRHQQGKVTVKYDRKELRKRLVLEEWIVEQLGQLYGCEVRGWGRRVPGAVAVAAFPSPPAASLAPGSLLLPRVAFRRWAEERCHRHLQMTFPVRRPHSATAPRLSGAPAQGMVKGAPCPIERVSPVPSRGEREGTALWGRAVAAARPGMEASFSSGGPRRLRQVRECQEVRPRRWWPGAAVPAAFQGRADRGSEALSPGWAGVSLR